MLMCCRSVSRLRDVRSLLIPPAVRRKTICGVLELRCCNISTKYPRISGMEAVMPATARRRLVVFDFDQTLVEACTYTVVSRMATERGVTLPVHLQTRPGLEGWPKYMRDILRFNNENNITTDDIRRKLESLPMVDGMTDLLAYLNAHRDSIYDTVILSDANMCFIQWVLQQHSLTDYWTKIFSNPAEVDDVGNLTIGDFHYQTDCDLSPKNMCKGQILHDYMTVQERNMGQAYQAIYYVGDGENDLCPGKRLTISDTFFVRKDFPLAKKLIDNHVSCSVELWSDGRQVQQRLRELDHL